MPVARVKTLLGMCHEFVTYVGAQRPMGGRAVGAALRAAEDPYLDMNFYVCAKDAQPRNPKRRLQPKSENTALQTE